MEKWVNSFCDIIPKDNYSMRLSAGEDGLLIHLEASNRFIEIDFGVTCAVNVFEEGLLLNPSPCFPVDIDAIPSSHPIDVLYEVENGRFAENIKMTLGEDLYCSLHYRQYGIITTNYIVTVIASDDPIIKVQLQ